MTVETLEDIPSSKFGTYVALLSKAKWLVAARAFSVVGGCDIY